MPVTGRELLFFKFWLWGRRLVLGGIAVWLLYMAAQLAATNPGAAVFVACIGIAVAWVGWFGGGRHASFSDDRQVHDERRQRYRGIR